MVSFNFCFVLIELVIKTVSNKLFSAGNSPAVKITIRKKIIRTEMKSCQRFSSFLEESAYELRSSFQFKKTS